jgi:hypothetical protein
MRENIRKDFTSCNALIYDEDMELLTSVKILSYDRNDNSIEVQSAPILDMVKKCELLILTEPLPYAYKGTIHKPMVNKADTSKMIKLYQENRRENRSESRYKINLSTSADHLMYEGEEYRLHTPLDVQLTDISKSGLRLRAKLNAFAEGNSFNIQLRIGENDTKMLVEVVNTHDVEPYYSEYGCRFVGKDN